MKCFSCKAQLSSATENGQVIGLVCDECGAYHCRADRAGWFLLSECGCLMCKSWEAHLVAEEKFVQEVSSSLWAAEPTYIRDKPEQLARATEIARRLMKEKKIPPAPEGHAKSSIHVVAKWLQERSKKDV